VSPFILTNVTASTPICRAAIFTLFATLILSLTSAYLVNIWQAISLFKGYLNTYRLILEAVSTAVDCWLPMLLRRRQQTTILSSWDYIKEINPRPKNGVIAGKSLNIPL
jgi:hypothetical protein